MTGEWGVDPSTTSITGLYATARHDLTWSEEILAAAGLDPDRLPRLMQSYINRAGRQPAQRGR